jgi:hypothetical protein
MVKQRKRPSGRKSRKVSVLPVPEVLLEAKRAADVVRVPARRAVAIEGAGSPDAPEFLGAIGALYGVAYGLKFARKPKGGDFKIGPLEGRWWAEGAPEGVFQAPRETWRWRVRIAVPSAVTPAQVTAVAKVAGQKKGGKLYGSEVLQRVFLERIPAARMGRILHVGPYSEEPASFEKMRAAVEAAGLRRVRPHVEIYLSDPRRTAPGKLRTVLLGEVQPRASR